MMRDGVININKPQDWTSQDVCAKLRHVLHVRKAGHTGTLDPMATGVLPVCLGKATRVIEYYGSDSKSYRAVMKLGVETDTLDMTGEIIRTGSYSKITEKAVREAFKAYTGLIRQIPPRYSALMIDGKRAYELARAGSDFEIAPREIVIYGNSVSRFDPEFGEIEFDVTCSKGTYIRTMCDDIGRTLGCGAAMSDLTRTASGYFRIEDSHTLEEVIEAADHPEKLEKLIIPADITLDKLGKVLLDDNRISAFMNGNSTWRGSFSVTGPSDFDDLYRVYSGAGFLGIAAVENGSLVPRKVFR